MKGSAFSKVISLILALSLLFSFSSCKDDSTEETISEYEEMTEAVIPGGSISVPYSSEDSLNPYYCTTVLNNALTSLIYRSLYRLDTSFTAVRELAASESLSGLFLKVFITPDLVFSDNGMLTADDVVYSFECAKKSKIYSPALDGITSCTAEDTYTVVFSLKSEDVNVLNSLIFPIVKNSTAGSEDFLPIGNGFYQYNQDGVRLSLKANLQYSGSLPEMGTVRLTDVSLNSDPENLVPSNEIDFYYSDLSDASVSDVNSSSTSIYLNNLVYLGINHGNVNLVLSSFRQAISCAIDRLRLSESAFSGYARGAAVPFNTSWSGYSSSLSSQSVSLTADPVRAQELLSLRGFGNDGTSFNLNLVCNESNAFIRKTASEIAASLAPFNINVNIQYFNSEDLRKTVTSGAYDLYIAEIKLPATMDLSQFFTIGGAASYGMIFDNITCDEAYFRYKKGEITLDDFITYFNNDMPFIPLVFRNGRFLYTRKITSELKATETALFGEADQWKFAQ